MVPVTVAELVRVLDGEVICGDGKLERKVSDFAASDLLSDILALGKDDYALLTCLNNVQVIQTAEITNACCVVILQGKQPRQAAVSLARRYGIPLSTSRYSMFDACGRLSRFLEKHDAGAEGSTDPSGA